MLGFGKSSPNGRTIRFTTLNTQVAQDAYAWYLGTAEQNRQQQQLLQYFLSELAWTKDDSDNAWPPDAFFSPQDGLLPVSLYSQDIGMPDALLTGTTQSEMTGTAGNPQFFEVMPVLIPGEYGTMKVHKEVTLITLLQLWNARLIPNCEVQPAHLQMPLGQLPIPEKFFLVEIHPDHVMKADMTKALEDSKAVPILHRESTDLTLYEVEHVEPWKAIKQRLPTIASAEFGTFGKLTAETCFTEPTEVTASLPTLEVPNFAAATLYRMSQVKLEAFVPDHTDILVLHCSGSSDAKSAFLNFWMTEDHLNWFKHVGRQCNVQFTDETTWRMIFRPCMTQPSMPVTLFRETLRWILFRTAFVSLSSGDGIEVSVKKTSKVLCHARFSPTMPIAPLIAALQHIQQLHPSRGTPCMISHGKRCTEPSTFQDLYDRQQTPGLVVIHIGMPIKGGGPSTKSPTAKQDFQKMVQSGVANMFLQYGLDLPQVTVSTEKLIQTVGLARLNHVLHGETQEESQQSFQMLCEMAKIQLPKEGPRMHLVSGKFRKLQNQKTMQQGFKINPVSYQLAEGFFLNADKSSATVLSQFSWHDSGVTLMSAKLAEELMATACASSPDELGIYVVGPVRIPPRYQVLEINAPATDDQGRQVLLNGRLIQLGDKHIQTIGLEKMVNTNSVQVAAVTLWREDFDTQMWNRICTSPVRTTKDLLALDGFHDLLGKPWGRTFRAKGQPVEAQFADSMQFHSEFPQSSRFQQLLRRSGHNKIYITPKSPTGGLESAWKVIWLPNMPSNQIESLSTTVAGAAGLVRGPKTFGLRIEDPRWYYANVFL